MTTAQQQKLNALPLLKNPLGQIGSHVKVPGKYSIAASRKGSKVREGAECVGVCSPRWLCRLGVLGTAI